MSDIFTNPYTAYSATPGVGDWIVRIDLDDLDAAAGTLTIRATVAGRTVNGGSANRAKDLTETTACIFVPITAAAGEAVVVTVQSNLAADSAGVTVASAATNSVRQTIDAGSSDHYQAVANTIVGRKIWHVAKTGNDANDGKSYDTAFLTIAAAVAVAGQGDEIIVWASGTDYDEAVDLSALDAIGLKVVRGAKITQSSGTTVLLGNHPEVFGGGIIEFTGSFGRAVLASNQDSPSIRDIEINSSDVSLKLIGCSSAMVVNCRLNGAEYALDFQNGEGIVAGNVLTTAGWTSCNSAAINCQSSDLLVESNDILTTVPAGDVSHMAIGIQKLDSHMTLVNNSIRAKALTGSHAYGIWARSGSSSPVVVIGGLIGVEAASGAYDIYQEAGPVYTSGAVYSTTYGTIINLDERAATNVWDDAIPGSPTAGSRDERLKALDEDFGTKLSGITSLAAWLRGLFRKDEMDATAKGEVNDDGGTYDEATDSQEAKQEYAVTIKSDAADAKTAAEAVDTLTKADGDGDLAEVASNVAETLATMPSAATIAAAVWDATTRTLSSFGTLVASIWAAASRTLTGSTLGLGPTASRSRTDGYYTCPQSGTIGLYRRILGWDGADLQQADVQSIAYSIFALSDDDPPERTAVEGHKDVELDKIAVLFDEVQSDEWASDYNFKHIPDVSTNQAFPEADAHYLVEYRLTPTAGQVIVERIKVRAI